MATTSRCATARARQLPNAKIDEDTETVFSEWLEEQSPQFKERLTTMYNRKFNCFVRPKYDGSHQTFPDLNLKGLPGIQSVYPVAEGFRLDDKNRTAAVSATMRLEPVKR